MRSRSVEIAPLTGFVEGPVSHDAVGGLRFFFVVEPYYMRGDELEAELAKKGSPCAVPTGLLGSQFVIGFPTSRRGANERCAYGAVIWRLCMQSSITSLFMRSSITSVCRESSLTNDLVRHECGWLEVFKRIAGSAIRVRRILPSPGKLRVSRRFVSRQPARVRIR